MPHYGNQVPPVLPFVGPPAPTGRTQPPPGAVGPPQPQPTQYPVPPGSIGPPAPKRGLRDILTDPLARKAMLTAGLSLLSGQGYGRAGLAGLQTLEQLRAQQKQEAQQARQEARQARRDKLEERRVAAEEKRAQQGETRLEQDKKFKEKELQILEKRVQNDAKKIASGSSDRVSTERFKIDVIAKELMRRQPGKYKTLDEARAAAISRADQRALIMGAIQQTAKDPFLTPEQKATQIQALKKALELPEEAGEQALDNEGAEGEQSPTTMKSARQQAAGREWRLTDRKGPDGQALWMDANGNFIAESDLRTVQERERRTGFSNEVKRLEQQLAQAKTPQEREALQRTLEKMRELKVE